MFIIYICLPQVVDFRCKHRGAKHGHCKFGVSLILTFTSTRDVFVTLDRLGEHGDHVQATTEEKRGLDDVAKAICARALEYGKGKPLHVLRLINADGTSRIVGALNAVS
jgi:hypothetical protein